MQLSYLCIWGSNTSDRASSSNRREWLASEGILVRDLALLVAAIELGSLTKAAEAAHLTQPAVSKRVALLERRYGLALLERWKGGVRPTEAGRILYAEARQILVGLERADAAMADLARHERRMLRVAASYTIGETLLPIWLAALRLDRPELLVDARVGNSAEVVACVLASDVDLGFVETPEPPAGVDYLEVGSDELVAVVAPASDLAHLDVVDASSLAAATFVTREQGSGTREAGARWLARLGAEPAQELALSSTGAVKGAVEAGAGFALLSRRAVERELAAGSLAELRVAVACPPRPLGAITKPGARAPEPALRLLALLRRPVADDRIGTAPPDSPGHRSRPSRLT